DPAGLLQEEGRPLGGLAGGQAVPERLGQVAPPHHHQTEQGLQEDGDTGPDVEGAQQPPGDDHDEDQQQGAVEPGGLAEQVGDRPGHHGGRQAADQALQPHAPLEAQPPVHTRSPTLWDCRSSSHAPATECCGPTRVDLQPASSNTWRSRADRRCGSASTSVSARPNASRSRTKAIAVLPGWRIIASSRSSCSSWATTAATTSTPPAVNVWAAAARGSSDVVLTGCTLASTVIAASRSIWCSAVPSATVPSVSRWTTKPSWTRWRATDARALTAHSKEGW